METVWPSHVELQKFCCILYECIHQALHARNFYWLAVIWFPTVASACDSHVHKTIKRLRPSKSVGTDSIPAFIIKGCSDILMPVLKFIFILNLSRRILPILWKQAVVFPTFKKRKTALVTNYRPISILSTFPKYSKLSFHTIWSPNLITVCMDSPNLNLQTQILLLICTSLPLGSFPASSRCHIYFYLSTLAV